MFNRTVFFWKIGVLSLVGSVAAWHMYCASVPWLDTLPAFLLFCIAPFFFSLAHNAIHAVPIWLAKVFAWAGGYWLIFTIYSFMGAVVYGLAWLLCAAAGFDWQSVGPRLSAYIRACILMILVVGSYRALVPVYRHISVETDKVEADTTIAFLSDTHFSPLLSHWFVKGMVRRIQSVHADAIIFGGDLIDAHLDFVRRDGSYTYINGLRAPLGVYAVYGNHDYFDSDVGELARLLPAVHFLADEQCPIGRNIVLTGMRDYIHYPNHAMPAADATAFNVAVDHEPLRMVPAARQGYDLYLAGHTHGGQFFPENVVTRRMYTLCYGVRRFGRLLAVVTSGYGFWGTPFRTGPRPEIVVLHIHRT